MKAKIYVIRDKNEIYSFYILQEIGSDKNYSIGKKKIENPEKAQEKLIEKSLINFPSTGFQFHLFLNELNNCPQYCQRAITNIRRIKSKQIVMVSLRAGKEFLDYTW